MLIEKPYKVAIVDDSPAMQKFLSDLCSRVPAFTPLCFSEGNAALEVIEREKVRLAFIDVNMPSIYGDDLLRKCVALKLGMQVYIITGADRVTIADRCLNVGARGIIPKPLLAEEFVVALQDAEKFFDKWNDTIRYFLKNASAAAKAKAG